MRKISALLFFLFVLALVINPKAYASDFTSSYLRINNPQANSALSGTVCAQASSPGAGIENSVEVTFPTDFTISASTTNWTTDTSNLPAGATAWPGISTNASAVSGKTVTFGSSDLTANVLYCFNFTASSSTTGATGNDKTGTITTRNNSSVTIDSNSYAVSIVSNSQISVTASVDPQVTDLPISLVSTTTGSQFPENTTLSYQITYGTNTVGTIPLTVQAQWSQGTINGSPTPSVDVLNYVIGSATTAYGSTAAVVDSVNRTITWTISSVPGGTTNQTVNFSLKTTSNYTGGNNVSFTVSARIISGSTVTTDKTVTQNYLYSSVSSGTTSTTTTTTTTPTPTPTPIPSSEITPASQLLSFSDISINSLSQSNAEISVTTNNSANVIISYGTSLKSLNQTVASSGYRKQTVLTIPNLYPNTNYYYKVTATDANKNSVTSDIFALTTATVSKAPEVNLSSLVITSNNTVLVNPQTLAVSGNQPIKNIIIIPQSNVFEVQFSISTSTKIRSIQLIVRNKNVLGANTFGTEDTNVGSNYVDLVETQPGIYRGRLLGNHDPGNYELYAKVIDYSGNIIIQKISDLKIVSNFKILEKGTNNPIEHARIVFYLYNPTTKTFNLISPSILPIDNPTFSGPDGIVNIVLPQGRYKADVSDINYHSKTVEFSIDENSSGYPTVYLENQPFSFINAISYFTSSIMDSLALNAQFIKFVSSSNRFFATLTVFGWITFVILAYLSFSARTHVSIFSIPYFFLHKLKLALPWTRQSIAVIKVIDNESKKSISKAFVSIIDSQSNQILIHAKTDKRGEFYFHKSLANEFKISVMKKGFLTNEGVIFKQLEMDKTPLTLTLTKDKNYKKPLAELAYLYIEGLVGILLEFILVTSFLFEAFFIYSFGFIKIAPFLLISSINVVLLFLYVYKPGSLES